MPVTAIADGGACVGAGTGTVTCDLWATTGTIALPNASSVPIWGYGLSSGAAQLPGPAIVVKQGDDVTITLHNDLPGPQRTSLALRGQRTLGGGAVVPDTSGVADASSGTYVFDAAAPGTFIYEAGLTEAGPVQVAMGLAGALVVRPTACATCAYGPGPNSAFNDEALVVLSELDPALNQAADPLVYDLDGWSPTYWMINGRAYPSTLPISVTANSAMLLRYANIGLQDHAMSLLGLRQRVVGIDGKPARYPSTVVDQLLPPGSTADAITNIPAGAPAGSRFALFNAASHTDNAGHDSGGGTVGWNESVGFGGMLTFLEIGGIGADPGGPLTTNAAASPNPANGSGNVTVTASVSDVTTGGQAIAAAEFFVDGVGANGTGTPMLAQDGTFNTATEGVTGTLSTATMALLLSGDHDLFVHGRDSANNWGPVDSVTLNLDKAGPAVVGAALGPNPTQGRTNVTIAATGTDAVTGNQDITNAEFFIDVAGANGTGTAMTTGGSPASVRMLTGTYPGSVPSPQPEGNRNVLIHARDALGNWGPLTSVHLIVDRTGPAAAAVAILPAGPNNGTLTWDINKFEIKVTASVSDPLSGSPAVQTRITAAEGFIDVVGAPGSGIAFLPSDGAWTTATEAVSQTFPLTGIQALSQGPHLIYVRGQDAAGNWGPTSSATLIIDKTGPTVGGVAVSPNPTNGAAFVALIGSATDPVNGAAPASNIAAAEWFEGADPGAGNGTSMSATSPPFNSTTEGISATINVSSWSNGSHTIRVRARDVAGNWGTTTSVVLVVSPPATFTALTPARLLDTRVNNGLNGAFSVGVPRTFQVSGRGGVPAGAVAVTGNLTVTEQTAAGYIFLGPTPIAAPTSSTLNFPLNDNRANGVTVALGAGGTLSATYVAPAGNTTALIFDVTGYFVSGSSGASYVPLTPARLLDTRVNNGLNGAFSVGVPRTFQVSGRGGVPAGAVAVTGNLTVTEQTAAGYIFLGPDPDRGTDQLDPELPAQ